MYGDVYDVYGDVSGYVCYVRDSSITYICCHQHVRPVFARLVEVRLTAAGASALIVSCRATDVVDIKMTSARHACAQHGHERAASKQLATSSHQLAAATNYQQPPTTELLPKSLFNSCTRGYKPTPTKTAFGYIYFLHTTESESRLAGP